MSRPRNSSGEYGRIPATCSTVVSMVNNGTISMIPPIATVSNDPISRKIAFFSKNSWRMNIVLLPRHGESAHRSRRRTTLLRQFGRRADDGSYQVIGHDQAPDQEEHPAQQADHVERVNRDNRFDERVLQEPEAVIGTPHQ